MARSTTEIQADIAVTRRRIESRLEAIDRRLPHAWWTPLALLGAAFVAGVLLARVPFLRLVRTGASTVQTGIAVAGTVAAVDRFLAERRDHAA
jgi:hypothetical protein